FEDRISHLRQVFDILRANQLYAVEEKCQFAATEIKFLGFIVGRNGLRVDPQKVQAISEWPSPANLKEVQQFMGLTNYLRKFIPRYAQICTPITNLMRKEIPFVWTDQAQ